MNTNTNNRKGIAVFRHYLSHTPEYRAWSNMLTRCYNKSCKEYKNYGGRGIDVYPKWRESFMAFYIHIGQKPFSPNPRQYSLDRIDNDGNYEPGNVRWATAKEQANNKRPRQSKGYSYRGVSRRLGRNGNPTWFAYIRYRGYNAYLGSYKTLENAIEARLEAENQISTEE